MVLSTAFNPRKIYHFSTIISLIITNLAFYYLPILVNHHFFLPASAGAAAVLPASLPDPPDAAVVLALLPPLACWFEALMLAKT